MMAHRSEKGPWENVVLLVLTYGLQAKKKFVLEDRKDLDGSKVVGE